MNSIHRSLANIGLVRDTSDRILGGVCSGFGRRFGIDAWAVRLLFVATLLVIPGSQFLVYPILWVVMPDEARAAQAGGRGFAQSPQ